MRRRRSRPSCGPPCPRWRRRARGALRSRGGIAPAGHDAFLRTLRRLRITELASDAELAGAAQPPVRPTAGTEAERDSLAHAADALEAQFARARAVWRPRGAGGSAAPARASSGASALPLAALSLIHI